MDSISIHNIQAGDEKAFEALFRKHYATLCNYAFKYISDPDEAEEIIQDMFFNFWQKRESLDIKINLEAYLFRSARNACLNHLKHLKIKEKYMVVNNEMMREHEQRVEDAVITLELQEKIDDIIENLPTERKRIFKMSRHEGLKYKEIAEKLDISIKTVEVQMGKALKFLRDHLSEYLVVLLLVVFEIILNLFEHAIR